MRERERLKERQTDRERDTDRQTDMSDSLKEPPFQKCLHRQFQVADPT